MIRSYRSIPACTGEPYSRRALCRRYTVYPRVYGGTNHLEIRLSVHDGLSPRVRGNPTGIPLADWQFRSIPACTGEPKLSKHYHTTYRVYPRVYGGTESLGSPDPGPWGLSPRVRGNRDPTPSFVTVRRSIPACTGEPGACGGGKGGIGVYPRVYGGTLPLHP